MTKDQILASEQKLYKAILESDINILDQLLHEDLLFIIPNGEVITKQMDMMSYKEGRLKIKKMTPTVENLNIIDDLAIITLTVELEGYYHENPFKSSYRYIRFWKEFSDGIKVVGGSGVVI